jgi:hypothetical protein
MQFLRLSTRGRGKDQVRLVGWFFPEPTSRRAKKYPKTGLGDPETKLRHLRTHLQTPAVIFRAISPFDSILAGSDLTFAEINVHPMLLRAAQCGRLWGVSPGCIFFWERVGFGYSNAVEIQLHEMFGSSSSSSAVAGSNAFRRLMAEYKGTLEFSASDNTKLFPSYLFPFLVFDLRLYLHVEALETIFSLFPPSNAFFRTGVDVFLSKMTFHNFCRPHRKSTRGHCGRTDQRR